MPGGKTIPEKDGVYFVITAEQGIYTIANFMELKDIDLTK
jgi:hypothetical protein